MKIYRLLLGFLLLGGISFGQTHTFPALDTNNLFTGSNTFQLVNSCKFNGVRLVDTANTCSWAGANAGAWINSAWNDCPTCKVYVASGTYNYSTTIVWPMATFGQASLECAPGANLTWNGGAGDMFQAFSTVGTPYANVNVTGCRFVGGTSTTNGIHLKAFNLARFVNVNVDIQAGDAVLNEGANTIFCTNCNLSNSGAANGVNGWHDVGVQVSGINYAANAVHFSGQIANFTGWGVLEDGTQAGTVGPNQNNKFDGVVFELDGSKTASATGTAFIQMCNNCSIINSYLEAKNGIIATDDIKLGDSSTGVCGAGNSCVAKGTVIRDNWMGDNGITNTIEAINANSLVVEGNVEDGAPTNFFNLGTLSRRVFIGQNLCAACTAYVTGTDNGDTVVMGSSSNNVTWVNASASGVRGYSFNQISGLNQDLTIRSRNAATFATKWQNAGGSTIAGLRDSGALDLNSGIIDLYNGIGTTGNGMASVQASSGAVTLGSGSSIAATSLCSTSQCPAGTYQVNVYMDVTTACATTGAYIVWVGYTDDAGAKTGSSTNTFIPINGLGVTQSTGSLALASTSNYGQGVAIVRTTGAATGGLGSINYGTTATACGTGGPMVGKMYLDVTRLE